MNTFELGQYGRTRTNVWHYAGVNSFRAGRLDELKLHPTVKPVALLVDALRDCSRRGDVVLDAFAGSGTTIVAAEQIGRRAYCLELDPAYADVSIRRWQTITKRDAILEATGQTFEELSALRSNSVAQTGKCNVRQAGGCDSDGCQARYADLCPCSEQDGELSRPLCVLDALHDGVMRGIGVTPTVAEGRKSVRLWSIRH